MAERPHIESPTNSKVKEAVRLRTRRGRRKAGRFLVEGWREIRLALESGLSPEFVFWDGNAATRDWVDEIENGGERVITVSAAVWRKLVVREGGDSVLGVFPIPEIAPDQLRLPQNPLVLAAAGVEKPGNIGALLRSADAFGVDAFLVEGGTDLWNPNVVRASLGCLFTVPVATAPAGRLLPWLRERGLVVVAATPEGELLPGAVDYHRPTALLVGSEEHGLDERMLAAADARVRIAMRGRADSLNVSVAAAVLLYEADRQRAE